MMKKKTKLYIAAGALLLTSVLSASTLATVKAENAFQFTVKKEKDTKLERTTLSKQDFIKKLIEEHNNNDEAQVAVWRLGDDSYYYGKTNTLLTSVKLKDLEQSLPDTVEFVTVNGKNMSINTVFVVEKGDILVNSEEEYNKLYQDHGLAMAEFKRIHTGLSIITPKHADNLLRANGLFRWGIIRKEMAGQTIYTQELGVTLDYAHIRAYRSAKIENNFEKYKENDKNIKEMLEKSGALAETTDENRVKKWLVYILRHINYDFGPTSGEDDIYSASSNILSLATRQLAQCVGFSLGTSRALNLMGIPAYMVGGDKKGEPHATVRAYYGDKWHTIETTGARANGKFSEENFYTRIDVYNVFDKSSSKYIYNIGNALGTMTVDKDFEDWAEKQKTEDLVLFNKEGILKHRNLQLVSDELKKNLIDRHNLLKTEYEKLKTAAEAQSDTHANVINGIKSAIDTLTKYVNDIEALSNKKYFYLERYRNHEAKMNGYSNVSYLANYVKNMTLDKSFETKLAELSKKADELFEKEMNMSKKSIKTATQDTNNASDVLKQEKVQPDDTTGLEQQKVNKQDTVKSETDKNTIDTKDNHEKSKQRVMPSEKTEEKQKENAKVETKKLERDDVNKKEVEEKAQAKEQQQAVEAKQKEAQRQQQDELKKQQEEAKKKSEKQHQENEMRKKAEAEKQRQQEAKQKEQDAKEKAQKQAELQKQQKAQEEAKRKQAEEQKRQVEQERQKQTELAKKQAEQKKQSNDAKPKYTGLVNNNGQWQFVRHDKVDTSYTGLVSYNNQWYYVQKGLLHWGVNAIASRENDTKMYYVSNATLDMTYTGLAQHANGTWYYVKNGMVDKTYSGLVLYHGTWYNVINGVLDWQYTGVVRYYNDLYYVQKGTLHWGVNGLVSPIKNGKTDMSMVYYVANSTVTAYTGLMKRADGKWIYLKNGQFDKTYSGLVLYHGTWYNVNNGILDWHYTSLVYYNGTWYYVQNGQLNWGQTALARNLKHGANSTLYYVTNSIFDSSYTGLAQAMDKTWHYIVNGVESKTFTGIVPYQGKQFYVQNGKINWHFSGKIQYNGKHYTIQNAQVINF